MIYHSLTEKSCYKNLYLLDYFITECGRFIGLVFKFFVSLKSKSEIQKIGHFKAKIWVSYLYKYGSVFFTNMGQFSLQIWVSYLDKYASFLFVTFITPVMFHIVYIPINTGLEVAPSSIKRRIVLAIIFVVLLNIFKKELSSAGFLNVLTLFIVQSGYIFLWNEQIKLLYQLCKTRKME